MVDLSLKRLKTLNLEEFPSHSLTDFYDILHTLMDAISLTQGIKFHGEGIHQELIEYIYEEGFIDEENRIFLQELRDYRNRINYEGFIVNKNYIKNNKENIEELIKQFKNYLEKELK